MRKSFSQSICKKLQLRLYELRSAETIEDLLAGTGNWHPLHYDREGQWGANLSRHERLVVTIDRTSTPNTSCVIEILDYHN